MHLRQNFRRVKVARVEGGGGRLEAAVRALAEGGGRALAKGEIAPRAECGGAPRTLRLSRCNVLPAILERGQERGQAGRRGVAVAVVGGPRIVRVAVALAVVDVATTRLLRGGLPGLVRGQRIVEPAQRERIRSHRQRQRPEVGQHLEHVGEIGPQRAGVPVAHVRGGIRLHVAQRVRAEQQGAVGPLWLRGSKINRRGAFFSHVYAFFEHFPLFNLLH
mmetsp:Transcript_100/g.284  ORF Transcript_100/g.284 Transcript_100/m.284 type:complete len:219 (-) Transcript_100:872-1528(-)